MTPRHPLLELTWARLVEFVRDPSALFWTFGFPIVLAVALGIAFRESPAEQARIAAPRGVPGSDVVVEALQDDAQFDVQALEPAALERDLVTGKLDVVVIPAAEGPWTYRYDPSRPEARAARLLVDEALQRASGRPDAFETTDAPLTEVGGRYIDFLVPGLIGLNIMGSAIWGIGFAVVDARRRKMLKRLAATPMSRSHFLLSYMLSRLFFLVAEVVALVGFGWLVFDVPVRGSILALGLVSIWGSLSMTGIALLIAARPRSTEAASGWGNLFMLPMWLLGGAFFSYERFPDATLPFIRALPLTALNDALRGIMNHGEPLTAQLPELAVLAVWGAVAFVLALKLFRWQ